MNLFFCLICAYLRLSATPICFLNSRGQPHDVCPALRRAVFEFCQQSRRNRSHTREGAHQRAGHRRDGVGVVSEADRAARDHLEIARRAREARDRSDYGPVRVKRATQPGERIAWLQFRGDGEVPAEFFRRRARAGRGKASFRLKVVARSAHATAAASSCAPSIPSGCVCVGRAESRACSHNSSGESANSSPAGAAARFTERPAREDVRRERAGYDDRAARSERV